MSSLEDKIIEFAKQQQKVSLSELEVALSANRDALLKAIAYLEKKRVLNISSSQQTVFEQTPQAKEFLENGFPEETIFEKASKEPVSINELTQLEKSFGISWAKKKGLIKIENGKIFALDKKITNEDLRNFLKSLDNKKASKQTINEAIKRNLVKAKSKKHIFITFNKQGVENYKSNKSNQQISQLTKELLLTGEWKNKEFMPYDINLNPKQISSAKFHGLTDIANYIKQIFLSMGFEEMTGSVVEQAFWNFDALFQPQDHPARELADTFYIDKTSKLPDKELVERVKASHEKGWKYKWNPNEAMKTVLRTHTTALSARYMSKLKKGEEKKYFAIGRVYRNEAIDFKHLAEFNQVEGIVVSEKANFSHLLGYLKTFYNKLGFDKVRFRPSFFPYTEPSIEIDVFFDKKGEWMEIGGAGIMRPEVSKPLFGSYPVLAWGLSLERPLMMIYDLVDIRTFYKNDMDFLRNRKRFSVMQK